MNKIKIFLKNLSNKLIYLIKLKLLKDKQLIDLEKFYSSKDSLFDFDLKQESIVFDVGGFEGYYSKKIYDNYGCNIFIFEPHPLFYKKINNNFKGVSKVKLFNFGLSNRDFEINISDKGAGSSVMNDVKNGTKVQIRSITDFIYESGIKRIDLIKLNIEGSEYEVLDDLFNNKLIRIIDNLLIQFHFVGDDSKLKRDLIQQKLSKTHKKNFDYYFVWESWTRIKQN